MVQRREHFRLALQPGHPLGIVGKRVGQHLDRNVALEPGVVGAIHLSHSACANLRQDFIRADTRALNEHYWAGCQLRITLIGAAAGASITVPIRNRWPSGAATYDRL